jgi:hypothetical protein
VSDQPPGEGWWLANDGNWYPPTSAPGPVPAPAPAPATPGPPAGLAPPPQAPVPPSASPWGAPGPAAPTPRAGVADAGPPGGVGRITVDTPDFARERTRTQRMRNGSLLVALLAVLAAYATWSLGSPDGPVRRRAATLADDSGRCESQRRELGAAIARARAAGFAALDVDGLIFVGELTTRPDDYGIVVDGPPETASRAIIFSIGACSRYERAKSGPGTCDSERSALEKAIASARRKNPLAFAPETSPGRRAMRTGMTQMPAPWVAELPDMDDLNWWSVDATGAIVPSIEDLNEDC